jgi:hypothetical protein
MSRRRSSSMRRRRTVDVPAWRVDDELVDQVGTHYMMLECRRHVARATFAASRVTCSACSPGSAAVVADTEVRAALQEGRRRAAVKIYEALGLDCEPRLRIPVHPTALTPTINTLNLVLDGLRRGPGVGACDPEVLVQTALEAAGLL